MSRWKIITSLSLLYLIWAAPQGPQPSTAASLFQARRHLALQQGAHNSNPKPIPEASPSPSPGPEVVKSKSPDANNVQGNPPNTEASPSPSPSPVVAKSKSPEANNVQGNAPKTEVAAQEICGQNFKECHDHVTNVTVCLLPKAEDANSGLFLLVHNDGQSSVELNVTLLPVNSTYNYADIPAHQVKKVNISSTASRSSSIIVNVGNWSCEVMEIRVRIPPGLPSYTAYVLKPINAAYLLFATAVLIGVMWAWCKLGRDGRHVNGASYQELEMGQQGSGSPRIVETLEGWDQSWDDEWDEEVAVKSAGGNHVGNGHAKGVDSRYAQSDEWGDDWND